MRKTCLVALLVLAMTVSVSYADEASHKKTVLKLLEVTNSQKMLDQTTTWMESMMRQQFDNLQLSPEGREAAAAVQKEMMAWFSEFLAWEKVRDIFIDIYIDVFTEDELNELIGFYQSPVGQKMLRKMPELMEKSMQKSQAIFQEKMPEFQQRLQKTLSELETKYGK
jgi:hypothetical protein